MTNLTKENTMKIQDPCILCNKSISKNAVSELWKKGNNAEPLASGTCCDNCNVAVVYARIQRIISMPNPNFKGLTND